MQQCILQQSLDMHGELQRRADVSAAALAVCRVAAACVLCSEAAPRLYNRLGCLRVRGGACVRIRSQQKAEQRLCNRCECAVETAVPGNAVLALQQLSSWLIAA
jgi:hypothetical protein